MQGKWRNKFKKKIINRENFTENFNNKKKKTMKVKMRKAF